MKTGTDRVEKDLERAKTAIDCIAYLADTLEAHVKESEYASLKNLLANLQINYVRIAEGEAVPDGKSQ